MKIAFVSTVLHYPWGGADAVWTSAAEAAQARGDSLLIAVSPAVANHPRIAALLRRQAVLCNRVPQEMQSRLAERLLRRLRVFPEHRNSLVTALRHFKPDLVVFSCGGTYDLIFESAICAWLRESRTLYRIVANWQAEHPSLSETHRMVATAILTGADIVGFLSSRNLEVTRRHLLAPLPNAKVLHTPLRWRPEDIQPWPAGSEWAMATVSRLDFGKGVHLLLHAAAKALRGESNWHLDIFGEGPACAYLRETADYLNLVQRVRFRGYVPELRTIWADNQLMISPAIDDGVPMTIPEAMLCERPVLATAVGGAEDWIIPDQTGFICPAPTVSLLTTSLRDAWNARHRWQAIGREAAARAEEHYRPNDYAILIHPRLPIPRSPASTV